MRFTFATASRILFGPGTLAQIGGLARELGTRALVVTGRSPERARVLFRALDAAGISHTGLAVGGEPTVDLVRDGIGLARAAACDVVLGFGGGSAIDAAKAIAAMLGNDGDLFDHLEVVGRAQPLTRASVPWIAIPTTAGTGSEVTSNAVLASPEHHVKVSLRSPLMLARVALVDPELTYALPPAVTASSGLDALTQLIEPFTSSRATPITDAVCREGLARASRALRRAYEGAAEAATVAMAGAGAVDAPAASGSPAASDSPEASDAPAAADTPTGAGATVSDEAWSPDPAMRSAREEMSLAALLGGLALANAGLGAAHGFAAPIGGAFPAPHGAVCGRLLPAVVAVNVRALRERAPGSDALSRYDEVGRIVTGRPAATAADAISWLTDLVAALDVPGLAAYGIRSADIPALVDAAAKASSMQANPIRLAPDELVEILERSM